MTSECITFQEIAEMTCEEVASLEKKAGHLKPSNQSDCQEFYRQVRSLESSVAYTYKLAVQLAKRTTDPKELSEIWKTGSDICDSVIKLLKDLKVSHPNCGTSELYDLALDYKNAAFKRHERNLEDIQWKDLETPPGLFPKSS